MFFSSVRTADSFPSSLIRVVFFDWHPLVSKEVGNSFLTAYRHHEWCFRAAPLFPLLCYLAPTHFDFSSPVCTIKERQRGAPVFPPVFLDSPFSLASHVFTDPGLCFIAECASLSAPFQDARPSQALLTFRALPGTKAPHLGFFFEPSLFKVIV